MHFNKQTPHKTHNSNSWCIPTTPISKNIQQEADPLAEIFNSINNNPALYATEQVNTTTKTHHQYEAQNTSGQEEADIEQYHKVAGNNQEEGTTNICEKLI